MNSWILFALLSAAAAGATAILAKIGVQGVPSNLATAVRAAVVLAWLTLGEPLSLRLAIGVGLMVVGAVLTIGA
jgi:uncharacterized membrane protein